MPLIYNCASHGAVPGNTMTAYAGVFGDHCVFRGANGVKMGDVVDGLSNTIMVVEASHAGIPWMKPEDVDIEKHPTLGDRQGFSSDHVGGVNAAMADGSVKFLSQHLNPQTLQALFTRDGNEKIGDF